MREKDWRWEPNAKAGKRRLGGKYYMSRMSQRDRAKRARKKKKEKTAAEKYGAASSNYPETTVACRD